MRKIVRLTESELSEVIKRTLAEKQGVPSNMYESAVRIYNDFISQLKSIPSDSTQNEFDFDLYGRYQISNYSFDGADFKLEIMSHNLTTYGIEFVGASIRQQNRIEGKKIIIKTNNGILDMDMRLIAPEGWKISDILEHIEKNRSKYISRFAHELKHAYDDSVKTTATIHSRSEYETFQGTRIEDIQPMTTFLHNSYFIHEIEEGVRASELYALLKSENITKSQFRKFFYDTEMIKKFIEVRDFKLTNLTI